MTKDKQSTGRSSSQIVKSLVQSIMEGHYAKDSVIPPERLLAKEYGVGRPTIREALQRMEQEGWISIRKGQPAVVNDFWKHGNLSTLVTIIQNQGAMTDEFIVYLLELRAALTPAYIRDALTFHHVKVVSLLANLEQLEDYAESYAAFDWELQKGLASLSPNPIYLLLLNSFNSFYLDMAKRYFSVSENREFSRSYYSRLLDLALKGDAEEGELLAKQTMNASVMLWKGHKE